MAGRVANPLHPSHPQGIPCCVLRGEPPPKRVKGDCGPSHHRTGTLRQPNIRRKWCSCRIERVGPGWVGLELVGLHSMRMKYRPFAAEPLHATITVVDGSAAGSKLGCTWDPVCWIPPSAYPGPRQRPGLFGRVFHDRSFLWHENVSGYSGIWFRGVSIRTGPVLVGGTRGGCGEGLPFVSACNVGTHWPTHTLAQPQGGVLLLPFVVLEQGSGGGNRPAADCPLEAAGLRPRPPPGALLVRTLSIRYPLVRRRSGPACPDWGPTRAWIRI